jgi:hypothetical protein
MNGLAKISGVPTEISFIDYKYRVELIILFILGFNNYLRVDQANKNGDWEMVPRERVVHASLIPNLCFPKQSTLFLRLSKQ